MTQQEKQVRNLRRRIEDYLRKCNIRTLIMVAEFLGIKIQKDLKDLKP